MHNAISVLISETTKEHTRISILKDDKEECSNILIQPAHSFTHLRSEESIFFLDYIVPKMYAGCCFTTLPGFPFP